MAETLAADAHKVYAGVRDLAGRNSAATVALRGKGVEVLALDVTSDAEVGDGIKSLLGIGIPRGKVIHLVKKPRGLDVIFEVAK
jgi:hypothetical protein